MNYTIGDTIIRIKNAAFSRRRKVTLPYSKVAKQLVELLVKEGFLSNVKEQDIESKKQITVEISRDQRVSVFTDVKLISKPSLRVYKTCRGIQAHIKRNMGKLIVTTSKGFMTGSDAVEKKLGGQLLFEIW